MNRGEHSRGAERRRVRMFVAATFARVVVAGIIEAIALLRVRIGRPGR